MTDVKHNVKEFNLEDVQANFEQVFSGVLLNGEPANITRDMGDAEPVAHSRHARVRAFRHA